MKIQIPFAFLLCAALGAHAGPGAHGPNGEHLDAPAGASAASFTPRIEAKSELFELVGRVEGGVLSVLVDRYETNEPVLEAIVEIEAGALKDKAVYRREQGDYAVSNAALVAALAKRGSHALVFAITAGADSDLLDATLRVSEEPKQGHASRTWPPATGTWIPAGLLATGAMGFALRRRLGAWARALRGSR